VRYIERAISAGLAALAGQGGDPNPAAQLGIQVNKTRDDTRDRSRLMCNLTSLAQSCGDFSPTWGFLLGHTVLARLAKGESNFRFQPR